MNMYYVKTGIMVIGLALLTYIFFPVSTKQGNVLTQSGQPTATRNHRDQSSTARPSSTRQTMPGKLAKKSGKKRVTEARIEPDTTLRKEGDRRRRSGPPSKMYGGL